MSPNISPFVHGAKALPGSSMGASSTPNLLDNSLYVVKKSITGNGNSSKEQVAFMLKKMVKLPDEKLALDATDALAVAWCHMMSNKGIPSSKKKTHQNHKKGDWTSFVEQNPDRVRKS